MLARPSLIIREAIDPAIITWRDAVIGDGGNVTIGRMRLNSRIVRKLKATSVWTKLDRLWLFAAEDSPSALRDLVNVSQASLVSAPAFTANRGFAGNGSTSYVNTNFTPSTSGVNYTQNSAHFSGRSLTDIGSGSNTQKLFGMFTTEASEQCECLVWSASNTFVGRINDVTNGSFSNSNSVGHFVFNRSASNARQAYRNAVSLGSDATASVGLPTVSVCMDRSQPGSAFGTLQLASGTFGASLSAADVINLYNAELAYMQAVGAA